MPIKEIQNRLAKAGHYHGAIDGIWGPVSRRALEAALDATPAAAAAAADPNDIQLIRELERDEGRVLHAYQDSLGFWTIGVGRLIDRRKGGGISNAEADMLKLNDIARVKRELDNRLGWWRQLDPVRQRAIQNMAFQLGVAGLAAFTTSLAHIQAGRWAAAGQSLRQSRWYDQTPNRAERVIRMIETGRAP